MARFFGVFLPKNRDVHVLFNNVTVYFCWSVFVDKCPKHGGKRTVDWQGFILQSPKRNHALPETRASSFFRANSHAGSSKLH